MQVGLGELPGDLAAQQELGLRLQEGTDLPRDLLVLRPGLHKHPPPCPPAFTDGGGKAGPTPSSSGARFSI